MGGTPAPGKVIAGELVAYLRKLDRRQHRERHVAKSIDLSHLKSVTVERDRRPAQSHITCASRIEIHRGFARSEPVRDCRNRSCRAQVARIGSKLVQQKDLHFTGLHFINRAHPVEPLIPGQFHDGDGMWIVAGKAEGGRGVVIDHSALGFFCSRAHVDDARFRVKICKVEVEHVFEPFGCDGVGNASNTALPGREPLERLTTVKSQRCDPASLLDVKRKFHVTGFDSHHGKIEVALAGERNAAIYVRPFRAARGQAII